MAAPSRGRRRPSQAPRAPVTPTATWPGVPATPCVQPAIGRHLRDVLARAGLSIDHVTQFSGVPRGTLQAVLGGAQVPSVNMLWRIANATGLPFGTLVPGRRPDAVLVERSAERQIFASPEGGFRMRPLLPFDERRRIEFYEVTVAVGHRQNSPAHAPGTLQSLILVRGELEIAAGHDPAQHLHSGDAMTFQADVPHSYLCLGHEDAVMHLVTSYIDPAC